MWETQRQRTLDALSTFLDTPLDTYLSRHKQVSAQEQALALFQNVAANVPAYGAFLQAHGIDPAKVKDFADFQALPLITKANYLQRYPLTELCRDGRLENCDIIAVSSGSTGKPGFWPRFLTDEFPIAVRFEQVFHDSFQADSRRTLAVVCFSLGTWVGGMFTTACCRHLAAKGYPITVVTPGNNKPEIFRIVEELGPTFEQVVLLGYPPFIKDVVDTGIAQGLDWRRQKIKMVFAGEVFSEEWRSLLGERVGAENPYCDSAALYGTADAGVLGVETPLSIAIRRFLAEHPRMARQLFGESRLPTLVQYDPLTRFFETHEGTLLFSGDNGIPLVRYHIADNGGLIEHEALLRFLADRGFDPRQALGRNARGMRDLPFVYVFGRSNFTVSYFGANVYPENISIGLEQADIRDWVTGKFVLEVQEDADRNRHLCIAVELAPGVEPDAVRRQRIADCILHHLLRLNSEFANYVPPAYRAPRVTLHHHGDPAYFPPGVKHRYTRGR